MKYRTIILGILSALLFTNCTKELPFPDATDSPLMVINSLFSPDQELEVHISQSCHIQDSKCTNSFIDDAEVFILDDIGNVLSTLVHKSEGIYTSPGVKVEYNTSYQIQVRSNNPSLADVESKSKTSQEVRCELLGIEEGTIDGELMWGFDIEIDDDPTEENYYLISGRFELPVGEHQEYESEINGVIEPHFKHRTDDPNADNRLIGAGVDIYTQPLRYVFLRDENFNGEVYTIKIGVADEDLYDFGNNEIKANITVKSVSKEMYAYIKSVTEYSLRGNNPFSEPQEIYTNVDNGLGIFAGYSQQTFTTDLPPSKYNRPVDVNIQNGGCTSPCIVKFSTDGGSGLSYFWDFGDGQTSTDANPDHSYNEPGIYQVQCVVQLGGGDSSGWNFEVTIY